MSDIFISYAREDLGRAKQLAEALQAQGWSVFWDRDIPVGKSWREVITKASHEARCVIVAWSRASIASVWVREEAEEGREREILVPVFFDEVRPPIGFGFIQAASLVNWDGRPTAEEFQQLVRAVADILGPPKQPAAPPRPAPHIPWGPGKPEFEPEDVWLGAAAPPYVSQNSKFVARFTAYTSAYQRYVAAVVEAEAPASKILFNLQACQWEPGTRVTVALSADELYIETSPQSFVWNGKWIVLRFDVAVPESIQTTYAVLKFDVYIEGLIVARLRPELRITAASPSSESIKVLAELKAPDTAFASYASRDRREVFGRVRSLQIFTGIDVFFDCLSVRPGEKWKDKIRSEISQRDIFWLFWSRNAKESAWVEWEWRTALADKTINAIQPHPLDSPDVAPPPMELAALQFGTLYESFLSQLKSSWLDRRIAQARKSTRRLLESSWLIALLLILLFTAGVLLLVGVPL